MQHAISLGLLTVAFALLLQAGSSAQEAEPIVLFPNGAPGALGNAAKDAPTLTLYLSPNARPGGATVIICPGGAYGHLAPHEGRDYALFLNQHGLTCFVLKYRLGTDGYRHPAMLQDVSRAVRYVRANSQTFQIDPNRIGLMGSSAGGHLASTLLTHFDAGDPQAADPIERVSSRPDFGVLCYPVITMGQFAHAGSRGNLLGREPSPESIELLSNELRVTAQTPPTFVWHGLNDKTVPAENSIDFAAALKKNGVPFELHLYENAAHGIGLGDKASPFKNNHAWTGDLVQWLKQRKMIETTPATQPTTKP